MNTKTRIIRIYLEALAVVPLGLLLVTDHKLLLSRLLRTCFRTIPALEYKNFTIVEPPAPPSTPRTQFKMLGLVVGLLPRCTQQSPRRWGGRAGPGLPFDSRSLTSIYF